MVLPTGPPPAEAVQVVQQLALERPQFHRQGGASWTALSGTLEMIARYANRGARTLETGCGASTVVFAAAGTSHTSISPTSDEYERVRAYCRQIGVDARTVSFVSGSSETVLPRMGTEPLDVVFIDGRHSFPSPVIDFHYSAERLRQGGVLILDDIPVPSVAVVFLFLQSSPDWRLLEIQDNRGAAFEKLADPPSGDDWRRQPFNRGYPDFSFLPLPARVRARVRVRARRARHRLGTRFPALGKVARGVRGSRTRPRDTT